MQLGKTTTVGQLAQARYEIKGRRYQALVDFDKETVTIRGYGFEKICHLKEYENFTGDMEAFVVNRLKL